MREERAKLKRELETALVRAEEVLLPSKETASSSISKNKPVSLGTASKAKPREQGELRAEIAQKGLSLRLNPYVYIIKKIHEASKL